MSNTTIPVILSGTERAQQIKNELQQKVIQYFGEKYNKYIAILYFWDNSSSATYVKFKKRYGEAIGIWCKVFGQEKENWNFEKISEIIAHLNTDDDCVGIMIQLPLPKELQNHKEELLASITPEKDIDGLWGIMSGLSAIDLVDFLPATPKAVIEILKTHNLDNLEGKNITIIGQSNLIGKPLAIECMKRWATVNCFNSMSDQDHLKATCKQSDIIISCTGVIHLVNEEFISNDTPNTQIFIDVGYGHDKNGKAVWDIDLESIKDKVYAYTPLPWGIGPLTIASLFDNVFVLQDLKKMLKKINILTTK